MLTFLISAPCSWEEHGAFFIPEAQAKLHKTLRFQEYSLPLRVKPIGAFFKESKWIPTLSAILLSKLSGSKNVAKLNFKIGSGIALYFIES